MKRGNVTPLNFWEKVSVVLLEPETPGNVGFTARTMKNFGFNKLMVVNPQCNILSNEAMSRAMHAKDILFNTEIVGSLEEVLMSHDLNIATTAKGESRSRVEHIYMKPDELAEKITQTRCKVALIFGRESTGLTRTEKRKCDLIARIPTDNRYPTMNISHAVTVFLYEIFKHGSGTPIKKENENIASKKEIDIILEWIRKIIEVISRRERRETQIKVIENVFYRSFMRKREAHVLSGLFRNIYRNLNGKNTVERRSLNKCDLLPYKYREGYE